VVIGDFSAANFGGESWFQNDWLSEFVAIILLGREAPKPNHHIDN
jgi:hypothetical protein